MTPPPPIMPRLPGRVSVRELRRDAMRAGRRAAFDAVVEAGSVFSGHDAETVLIAVGVGKMLVGERSATTMPERVEA